MYGTAVLDCAIPNRRVAPGALAVGRPEHDTVALASLFASRGWRLHEAESVALAGPILRSESLDLVFCDRQITDGSWTDVLRLTVLLSPPPALVLTSFHAGWDLWLEALDAGAFDLLGRPYDLKEVERTVRLITERPIARPIAPSIGSSARTITISA